MGRVEVKRKEAAEGTSDRCPCANPVAAAPSTQMASLVQLLEDRALGCEPLTSLKPSSRDKLLAFLVVIFDDTKQNFNKQRLSKVNEY